MTSREYELILHGATGYTGNFAASYISKSQPTNLRWAIAGRSRQKLERIVAQFKEQYPDRDQPAIEVVQLDKDELHALARKGTVLVNTVGPYAKYGEVVVEACASNGTHYLDVTGESPWTKDMVDRYHNLARKTGAIIITQIGIESAPSDILTYVMVKHLYKTTSQPAREAFVSMLDIKGVPSGGTLATVFNLFDYYNPSQIMAAAKPEAISILSVAKPSSASPRSFLGVKSVPDVGTVTTSVQASADVPIVHRSWGLFRSAKEQFPGISEAYGSQFNFYCHMNARNLFMGILTHFTFSLASLFLLIPPVRWFLGRMVPQPGEGSSDDDARSHYVEYRGAAVTEQGHGAPKIVGRWRSEGNHYYMTAVFMVEGAATILYDGDKVPARRMGGGHLTPATLGDTFVDRLRSGGVTIETDVVARSHLFRS